MPTTPRRGRSQTWSTFVRNHAQALLACDFMVAITVRFRILYILVVMEVGSRRMLHCNVTDQTSTEWTIQQLREAIPSEHSYRFLIHDRHSTFSAELDEAVRNLGIEALRTFVRTPQANAFCERLIGTIRRECLDFMIPLSDRHLRQTIRQWMTHYNRGRPHSSLGPGIPTGLLRRSKGNNDIYYEPMSELSPQRSWRDFITNTVSNEWLHSVHRVFAEHSRRATLSEK